MRWWHIDELLPIEADLFGAEQWSAGMFWNELANGHYYLVALDDRGRGRGYGGLAVVAAGRGLGAEHRGPPGRASAAASAGPCWTALLAEAAEPRGRRQCCWRSRSTTAPAQKLYAAYGFDGVGVRRGYYQPSNTDALVMRRELT